MLGSMDGADSLLILAGWCKVFHQSTENFIIGRLIEPTMIKIAVIFSPTRILLNEFLSKIIIRYKINKIATEVNLASQTQNVPHIGLPQSEPVIRQIRVNVAPMGAMAALIVKLNGILKARPKML